MKIKFWATLALFLCFLSPTMAQLQVTSTTPATASLTYVAYDTIQVVFSEDVDPNSLSAGLIVTGSQSGICEFTVEYDQATFTAHYIPTRPFQEGEVVSAIATAGILSAGGAALVPYQWEFITITQEGSATFNLLGDYDIGAQKEPVAAVAIDINNDGYIDIATANSGTGSVSVMRNNLRTNGGFTTPTVVDIGLGINAIAEIDVNGDAFNDLAVTNLFNNSVSILQNNGVFGFTTSTFTTGQNPTYLTVADLNNDARDDIIVVAFGGNSLSIHLNQGGGVFTETTLPTSNSPLMVTARDLENDGDLDLVVPAAADSVLQVFLNDGTGQFNLSSTFQLNYLPSEIVIADLVGVTATSFGDGAVDIAVIAQDRPVISIFQQDINAPLTFTETQSVWPAVTTADAGKTQVLVSQPQLVFADIDVTDAVAGLGKDHDLDLVGTAFGAGNLIGAINSSGASLTEGTTLTTGLNAPTDLIAADFDRDGDIDFAVPSLTESTIQIFENAGGRATDIISLTSSQLVFGGICVADSDTIEVRVLNVSNEGQTINALVTSGRSNYVVEPLSATIAPEDSATFYVILTPTTTGTLNGILQLSSVGVYSGRGSALGYSMTGTGLQGEIDVSTTTIDFGDVYVGESASETFRIVNRGNTTASVSEIQQNLPAIFNISTASPIDIPEISSWPVTVTFSPDVVGPFSDTLIVIGSGDCQISQDSVVIVTGNGLPSTPDLVAVDLTTTATEFSAGQPYTFTAQVRADFYQVTTPIEGYFRLYQDGNLVQQFPTIIVANSMARDEVQFVAQEITFPTLGRYRITFNVDPENIIVERDDANNTATYDLNLFPDLTADEITSAGQNVSLNTSMLFTGRLSTNHIGVNSPFRITFLLNGQPIDDADSTIFQINPNQQISFSRNITFTQRGTNTVSFFVDSDREIDELSEENNELSKEINVKAGEAYVRPNPFTPNNDGFNDLAIIHFEQTGATNPTVKIFNIDGRLINTITTSQNDAIEWNGLDFNGRELLPGVYLYMIEENGEVIGTGHLTLAR